MDGGDLVLGQRAGGVAFGGGAEGAVADQHAEVEGQVEAADGVEVFRERLE